MITFESHNGFHSFIQPFELCSIQTETNVNAHEHTLRTSESERKNRTKHSHEMYRTSFAFLLFVCLLACLFVEFFSPFVRLFIHSFFLSSFVLCFISRSLPSPCAVNEVFHFYTCFVSMLLFWLRHWIHSFDGSLVCFFLFVAVDVYFPHHLSPSLSLALTTRPLFCRSFGSFSFFLLLLEVIYGTHMSFGRERYGFLNEIPSKRQHSDDETTLKEQKWEKCYICWQTCTDAFNFVLFIHFIRSATTNTARIREFRCTWQRIMANRLPPLSFAIHTIHFHSRIYDIFCFVLSEYSTFSRFRWFDLCLSLSLYLALSMFRSICLDFHHFSMRSWLSFMHANTVRVHCVRLSLPLYFLFFLLCKSAFFFVARHIFLTAKRQVIFHLCALFLLAVRFVCFISRWCCCCRCHSSDLNLSLNTSMSMASAATATAASHAGSSNVYHSTIFSF